MTDTSLHIPARDMLITGPASDLLHIPDAMVAPSAWPPADPLALPTKYELDPFQKHAVLGIHAGDHVFVTAKTGSGKTFVGEYLCARALAAGKRVFYTTPIKSLSNQKYHDLKRLFPNATVGILTGDIKMCPDAQIVVMTAEILRNLFYKRGTATEGVGMTAAVSLEGVAGIVMDEVHYIQDPDRGHVWEESLILAPRDLQLVLLSATLPSADTLARWLAELHGRRTVLLSTTYRIVPLVHGVLTPSESGWRVTPVLDAGGSWLSSAYPEWLRGRKAIEDAAAAHRKAVRDRERGSSASGPGKLWNRGEHDKAHDATADALRASKVRVESPIARVQRTVDWLVKTGQCPALFFLFSRRDCERYAAQAVQGSLLDSSDTAAAEHIFDFHLSRHRTTLEKSPQYHQVRDLVTRGVAFHHSGLLPLLKEIVEILFTRGYVRALFATETFSVGLNMPTKTVVFLELEKWCDGGRRPLRPDEYIQMAGRAGRRGLDKQGLVLYEPVRDPIESGMLKAMLTGGLPPLTSRMRFSYEFLLRLKLMEKSGKILDLASQSYWAVGQRAALAQAQRELADLEAKVVDAESRMPPAIAKALAERDDLERAISENVNAKRKKAEAALRGWDLEHDGDFPKGQLAAAQQRWRALREVKEARDRLAREVAEWEASPLLSLAREQKCLTAWGFLEASGSLTEMGICATEVNEGHPLLMPWLACALPDLEPIDAEDIPCVLATFLREGSDPEDAPELDLSAAARTAIKMVAKQAESWFSFDGIHGPRSPDSMWRLSRLWPAIAAQWMAGASVAEIAATWSLMEGNVQRGLLKVANLLEEWGALATVRRDLATLEKLANLRFLRDDIVVDSIYLRLN
jgi:superfamily II RNA helicase